MSNNIHISWSNKDLKEQHMMENHRKWITFLPYYSSIYSNFMLNTLHARYWNNKFVISQLE